ncbi:uncharacterized protein LOC128182061 isoform X2 [Crassostrea angulata]|uniref:uncharacterized protein LOC128182061 isoform X2 n=1 Tax=Magallana angulata TaxID=2784310 RepID=UPI0022B15B7C|nr:uncharacterized protein LOC128182061 isoform X2 [Crassostrea angulata]
MWNRNDEYDWYHGQRNYIPLSSTRGNWMNILIGERNVDGDSSIASSSKPRRTTIRGNSRSRKTCVTTTLVGIAFVLLLLGASCVPLILYFVEKDQYKYYKADGSITFEGTYDDSLGNLSTQTSIDFQQDFCQVMEQTQANKFKESYSGCLVTKIKNGSIIVEFTMYYYAKVTVEPDEVKEEIIVNLKTNLTETFSSKFSITVDVNSLTVSLLQTGENDFQSGKSDSRFQTSLLSSTTKGTTSTILPTISSNTENSTSTETTRVFPKSTTTATPTTTTIAPLETTTIYAPTTTTAAKTTTSNSRASTTAASSKTTTTDKPTTVPPKTTIIDTSSSTTTAETTTTDTVPTTTTVPSQTTITDTPALTTTVPSETTTTDKLTTTTTALPESTTTDKPTTTTTAPPETTTTDKPTITITAHPETTTTDTPTTTTTVPSQTTITDTQASTTTALPETTTIDKSTTTTTAPLETTTTETQTTTTTSETTTTSPPISREAISDITISHSSITTTFITVSHLENDTTTAGITAATTMPVEPFAVVDMMNSVGEIGKQAYIPCTINITSGDWARIYIYQTHNDNIDPKIATITKNGTITIFTSDPVLVPTFNISGSQIEAVVTFNFSNYDFLNCSVRIYKFICSLEMTTGSTFNASAEFNLIAPLFQPTVILHGTRYMVNQTANVSLAAINATCNTSRDRYSDTASLIGMRIQNASGADITSFVDVTPYNISTDTCGELVFIQWSDVFLYRSDLNGSNLTCFVETASKSVMSESITLTFLEQQNPTLISTANPAVTNSINADTTLTTPVDISSESSPGTTTKNPPIIASTEMSTTTTTTTQVLSPPYAVVVMKNSIGEIGKQAYIPCTINITSGDWAIIYIYQSHNDNIDPKIATISNNGTKLDFTSDPLLMTTFNISGSQIEAVVTFNFSNYDFSNCSVRLYRFTCSVEMTTGSTFNASAELNLIAPLIQPTVTLHRTQYMFNKTANVSLAGINATCNATQDRSSDYSFTIAMRIQNVSGDDIDSLAEVNSYNVSTNTCGELVFINWSDVFIYRADLNGSSLTCYIKSNDRTVTSENITLTFVEQQMPP